MIQEKITRYIKLLILSIIGGVAIGHAQFYSPLFFEVAPNRSGCEVPIHWSLGNFDERFPGSQKDFLLTAFKAEKIWEDTIGKDLFIFDSSSSFEIKTEFDERQEKTYEAQDISDQIDDYETQSKLLQYKYDSLIEKYESDLVIFNAKIEAYEKDLDDYNDDVSKWNKKGGAPEKEYEKLQEEMEDLQERAIDLEEEKNKLIASANKINNLANQLNIQVENINEEIETFNEKYGEPTPFIQGLYMPVLDNITVFQFQARDDLRLVLAHELGHALGIKDHVEDPSSIMHYLMNEQDINNPKLSKEDIDAYNSICPPRNLSKIEQFKRYLIYTAWEDMQISEILKIIRQD